MGGQPSTTMQCVWWAHKKTCHTQDIHAAAWTDWQFTLQFVASVNSGWIFTFFPKHRVRHSVYACTYFGRSRSHACSLFAIYNQLGLEWDMSSACTTAGVLLASHSPGNWTPRQVMGVIVFLHGSSTELLTCTHATVLYVACVAVLYVGWLNIFFGWPQQFASWLRYLSLRGTFLLSKSIIT